jgi:WD40 repeat protein
MIKINYQLRLAAVLLLGLGAVGTYGSLANQSMAKAVRTSGAPNTAQDKKAQIDAETIRNLIKDLGHDSFEKRDAADKALTAIGEPALEFLRKAAAESTDAEVRQRAGQLVSMIIANKFAEVRRFTPETKETKPQATCVVITPDGRHIVSSTGQYLHSWDAESGKQIQEFGASQKPFYRSLAISADGKQVLAGGTEKILGLFDLETGKQLKQLVGHTNAVYAAMLLPGRKEAITGGFDRSIRVWDLESGAQVRIFENVPDNPRTFALSKDGKILAAGHFSVADDKGTVRLWDLEKGKQILAMPGHLKQVSSVAYSPDGKTLLSASFDGTMRLWNPVTGEVLKRYQDRPQQIESAAFTPDGSRIVSVGSLKLATVRVWDVASGKLVFESEPINSGFFGLAIMPDGRHFVTAGKDGLVRMWRLTK